MRKARVVFYLVFLCLFLQNGISYGNDLKEFILNEDCYSSGSYRQKFLKGESIEIYGFIFLDIYYAYAPVDGGNRSLRIPLNKFQSYKFTDELTQDFFASYENGGKFLYPTYIIDAVYKKDRNHITRYDKYNTDVMTSNYDIEEFWYQYTIKPQLVSDKGLRLGSAYGLDNFFIKNIKKVNDYEYYFDTFIEKEPGARLVNPVFEEYSDGDNIKLRLKKKGDYLELYIGNELKPRETYCYVDNDFRKAIDIFIRYNTCFTKNLTWPRHADGTCVYDTNAIPNKPMIVSENLKLRSGENTYTQVLTVMEAGTRVEILELGKFEVIDDIGNYWMKVEVQAGSKDRDGKPIREGTVGWCFGGYLE